MHTLNEKAWKILLNIPYAKSFALIINTYVWNGDEKSLSMFAPFNLYFWKFFFRPLFIFLAAYATIKHGQCNDLIKSSDLKLLELCLSLFPNILGFGIGGYALIFTFPGSFFSNLEDNKNNLNLRVGAHGLNAIIAFPLLMIANIILLSIILNIFNIPQTIIDSIGLFFLIYGMLLTIELVSVLFTSARKVIRNFGKK